jgi:hypothetical protein
MSPPTLRHSASRRRAALRHLPALVLAVAAYPAAARAQDAAALASRRELIAQAQQARVSGNHQQALELAERASRIQMSPSLRLFVAQELNSLGRLAEAYGTADLCMREAESDTTMRNREQVASTCRALAADLRGRIARVVVQVPSPAPAGLQVRVAGSAVSDSLWGVPYVVTPGAVAIDASANGYRTFHTEVTVAAGATSDVRIALEPAPDGGAQVSTQGTSNAAPVTTTPATSGTPVPIAPLVVAGVGVVGLVLAPVFFFALRNPAVASAQTICPNFTCPDAAAQVSAQPYMDSAATWNTLTWVAGGVGIAALAGGLAWFFVARSHGSHPAQPAHAFHVAPVQGGVMLGLEGRF